MSKRSLCPTRGWLLNQVYSSDYYYGGDMCTRLSHNFPKNECIIQKVIPKVRPGLYRTFSSLSSDRTLITPSIHHPFLTSKGTHQTIKVTEVSSLVGSKESSNGSTPRHFLIPPHSEFITVISLSFFTSVWGNMPFFSFDHVIRRRSR